MPFTRFSYLIQTARLSRRDRRRLEELEDQLELCERNHQQLQVDMAMEDDACKLCMINFGLIAK